MSSRPSLGPKQYSSVSGAIFNDQRDIVAKKLLAQGASKAFVEETLKAESARYCHQPASVTEPQATSEDRVDKLPSVYNEFNLHSTRSIDNEPPIVQKKVTIVGAGNVGLAIAFSIINQGTASMLALIDHPSQATKLEGEVKDLQQGSAYNRRVRIEGSTEYDVSRDSNFVVITAGLARKVSLCSQIRN